MASLGFRSSGLHHLTEVCTYYYDNKKTYPTGLKQEVEKALAKAES